MQSSYAVGINEYFTFTSSIVGMSVVSFFLITEKHYQYDIVGARKDIIFYFLFFIITDGKKLHLGARDSFKNVHD
jgi:hypothetical protein